MTVREINRSLLLFVLALVGASAAIGLADRRDRASLAWALLALVSMLSFTRRRLRDGLVAGVVAAAAFAALVVVQDRMAGGGPRGPLAASIAVSVLVLVVAPVAVRLLTRELRLQQERIDQLARRDEATGAYRPGYLASFLQEEVERGRRSERSFTVCLLGLDRWPEMVDDLGAHEADRRLKGAVGAVGASQRTLDKVVDLGGGEVVLVLPETPLGGAETVAWRIQTTIAAELPVPVRIGIAEFPRDAVTEHGLMEEARQALEFARRANIPVVDRSLLGVE